MGDQAMSAAKKLRSDTETCSVSASTIRFAPPPRCVLGVIQIATDLVMDIEGSLLVSQIPQVEIRYTKIAFEQEEICSDTYLKAFESGAIKHAVESLRWPKCNLDGGSYVTLYGISCTSMSFILGEGRLKTCFPDSSKITDMWKGVLAALRYARVKRIAVLTPYIKAVSAKNEQLLCDEGFAVVASMSLGLTRDVETSAVTQDFISECVMKLVTQGNPEAVFIGCSAFRACTPGFISSLEKQTGLTIITSTQAFLWNMLRSCGVEDHVQGYGRLFEEL